MTEDEVEAVAQELAKIGGASWYPGRTAGPLLRAVTERYKDRARVAIAALERFRAARTPVAGEAHAPHQDPLAKATIGGHALQSGTVVVYRPPGDQRAVVCRIAEIADGQAYLVPIPQPAIGWVSLESLQPLESTETPVVPKDPAG